MIDFTKELNAEQLDVVTKADGPCLVLAGAGSGKTRAITYRVAYLLEKGVDPKNILLVTFTNKAAREMMERVSELTSDLTPCPPPYLTPCPPLYLTPCPSPCKGEGGIQLPWSGTFHHIGYRILKKYATKLGFKNNFSVLDSQDSLDLIKTCLKAEGIDRKEKRFPSPKVIQSIISYARNAETTIEDVLELKHPNFLEIVEVIRRIAEDYRNKKKESNVMDFDDLLVYWYLILLKDEGARNKFSEQFEYILVDEYQDTNKIQASIINLLASKHRNLLVVGDDAQSIYSFRAADIKNILDFSARGGSASGGEGYPDAKIFKLEINYRSTPDILDLANNVISNNVKQYKKELRSILSLCGGSPRGRENFTKPEIHAFQDQTEEAIFIVNRIEELMEEGVDSNKIAVLFRAAHHSQALEMELVKKGIDYDYRGGVRFFERAHIKDVLAYLRILNNEEDRVAWSRVLNIQVGIGPATIELITKTLALSGSKHENTKTPSRCTSGSKHENNLSRPNVGTKTQLTIEGLKSVGSVLGAKAQMGWNDFLQIFEPLLDLNKPENSIGDLIRVIIESKYKEYLENEYPDYRERLQDLEQLAGFADNAEDLNSFLAEATLQEGFNSLVVQTQHGVFSQGDKTEKIILSTVHQAKGLEWEAVFVINLSAGQFPNDRALRESDGLEEERRLFYVAITRAKKYLHLTYSLSGGFNSFSQGPSMFLEEINSDLVDINSVGGGTVWDELSDGDVVYEPEDSGGVRRHGFLKGIEDL